MFKNITEGVTDLVHTRTRLEPTHIVYKAPRTVSNLIISWPGRNRNIRSRSSMGSFDKRDACTDMMINGRCGRSL